jgi:hypothetical protein
MPTGGHYERGETTFRASPPAAIASLSSLELLFKHRFMTGMALNEIDDDATIQIDQIHQSPQALRFS